MKYLFLPAAVYFPSSPEADFFSPYFNVGPAACAARTGRMEQICVLAAHLSDLLYLGPPFPNERATLAGRDDQPQGDWWLGADGSVGHQCGQVLEGDVGKEKKNVVRGDRKQRAERERETGRVPERKKHAGQSENGGREKLLEGFISNNQVRRGSELILLDNLGFTLI